MGGLNMKHPLSPNRVLSKEKRLAVSSCQPFVLIELLGVRTFEIRSPDDPISGGRGTLRGCLRPSRALRSRAQPPDRVPQNRGRKAVRNTDVPSRGPRGLRQ
jgi:hypothetical protein